MVLNLFIYLYKKKETIAYVQPSQKNITINFHPNKKCQNHGYMSYIVSAQYELPKLLI